MSTSGWKYYNHAAIPTTAPHEIANTKLIEDGTIWSIAGKSPLLARWTTEFDCKNETHWWYIIKDTPFDIESLKSKRRYEIKKGQKNYQITEINPNDYADELLFISAQAYSAWPKKYRPVIDSISFKNGLTQWKYHVLGAFDISTGQIRGYALLEDKGSYIDFVSLRVCPEDEKKAINAAMVAGILEKYHESIEKGCYICDGSRSIMHETAFQDYLQKYFGFRKAYCKLHIVYRNPIGTLVKIVYPFRKILCAKKGLLYQFHCVLKMEEIVRADR